MPMADEELGAKPAVKACCTEAPDTKKRLMPMVDDEQGAEDAAKACCTEAPDIATKQLPKTLERARLRQVLRSWAIGPFPNVAPAGHSTSP
eukprot:12111955-Alexandrium_andersonii.AAC.1